MKLVPLNEPFWLATSPVVVDQGAKVELVKRGTSEKVAVLSAESEGAELEQPLVCGPIGIPVDVKTAVSGWAAPGSYDWLVGAPPAEGEEDKRQRIAVELPRGDADAAFEAGLSSKLDVSEKGVANGVATLDGSGKVPATQLTVDALEYKGTWNATTNSPALANGSGNAGDMYRVSVAGTHDFGAGAINFTVGDFAIYDGSIWQKVGGASGAEVTLGTAGEAGKALAADDLVIRSPGAETDVTPLILAAWDAGKNVDLDPRDVYYVNSALFADSSNVYRKYILDCRGAEITFGPNLPAASAAQGLAGIKYWIFNNTLRSALSGGTVTVDEAHCSTGEVLTPGQRVTVRSGVFNANGNIIGICFSNNAAAHLVAPTLHNIQNGIDWIGYSDLNKVTDPQVRGGNPSGSGNNSRIVYQRESGDGVQILGAKGFGAVVADLAGTQGAGIRDCVSGQGILTSFQGEISNWHQETDEISTLPYSLLLDRAQLLYMASRTNAAKSATKHTIIVNDDPASTAATDFHAIKWTDLVFFRGTDPVDFARGASLYIEHLNKNGRVVIEDCQTLVQNGVGGTGYYQPEGLMVASADAAIQAALDAGADLIAGGNWELSYHTNGWVVSAIGRQRPPRRHLSAPVLEAVTDETGVKGSLTPGTTYEFCAGLYSAAGRLTSLSAPVTAKASANGAIQLNVTNPAPGSQVVIFRADAKVTEEPDFEIRIPMGGRGRTASWWDFGAHVNGRAWGAPAITNPKATALSYTVSNTTQPAGAKFITFDRMTEAFTSVERTSGKIDMTLIEHEGGFLSACYVKTGGQKGEGVTHGWLAIVDFLGKVRAVSADVTAWPEGEKVKLELTAPINLPPGIYYAALSITAATKMPKIVASSGASSLLASEAPIACGESATAGGAPPAIGGTIAIPTKASTFAPEAWGVGT